MNGHLLGAPPSSFSNRYQNQTRNVLSVTDYFPRFIYALNRGGEIDLIVPRGEIKELSETLDFFFFLQFNSQLMMIELTVGSPEALRYNPSLGGI